MKNKRASNKGKQNNQKIRAKPVYFEGCIAQRVIKPLTCKKCGRNHLGAFRNDFTCCFKCVINGHFMRERPNNKKGNKNWGNKY